MSWAEVLSWGQSIGRQHDIIVATVRSDTTNGQRGRTHKLILGCEGGGNDKKQKRLKVTCGKRVKYHFKLSSLSSDCGRNITIRCGIHKHYLVKYLNGHNILGCLKPDEI